MSKHIASIQRDLGSSDHGRHVTLLLRDGKNVDALDYSTGSAIHLSEGTATPLVELACPADRLLYVVPTGSLVGQGLLAAVAARLAPHHKLAFRAGLIDDLTV